MDVKVKINAAEWSFEEEIPFEVESIKEKEEDFNLPLFDEEGNEQEVVTLPNCYILELVGDEDEFHVIFEKDLIQDNKQFENEEGVIVKEISFFVDKQLWHQGEDIGVFYSWNSLPENLKNLKVKNHE